MDYFNTCNKCSFVVSYLYRIQEVTQMLKYRIDVLAALKNTGYTSYKIRKDKLIGEAQLTKIRRGEIASKETLNTICKLLNCQPGDILMYEPDEQV